MSKKVLLKYIILWIIGGTLYYHTEILYRGFSHPAMFVVGGIAFLICGLLNEGFNWDTPLLEQIIIADLLVTGLEFISGLILNVGLGLNIWDYRNLPLNVMGQICVPYMLLWIPLCLIGIVLDDWIRWKLFGEEKPHYHWFKKKTETK